MATFSLRDIQRNCCVVYDDESGETADVTSVQPRGWTATLDGQRVAAYVDDNNRLILQIATDKFDLDNGQTRAFGRNDYTTNTANFRITEDDRSRHLRYPGWWTEWGYGEPEVMARAEMNEYEDTMGWVWRVLADPKAREDEKQHLLSLRCS